MAFRRIEELTQELAASNQLVEMLSAEKRGLQQCLEGCPVGEGQVSGQGWGGGHLLRAWLVVVIPVPFWGCGQGRAVFSLAGWGDCQELGGAGGLRGHGVSCQGTGHQPVQSLCGCWCLLLPSAI